MVWKRDSAVSTIRAAVAASPMSPSTVATRPDGAMPADSLIRRAHATTLYPRSTNRLVTPAPIPRDAPVTTTVLRGSLMAARSPLRSHPGRASTVLELGALPNLDDVAVGIANVAARLTVLRYRLRDELCTSTLPQVVASSNVRNADVHEAADLVGVGEDAERDRRLVRGGPATDVDGEPRIRDLDVPRRTLPLASARD